MVMVLVKVASDSHLIGKRRYQPGLDYCVLLLGMIMVIIIEMLRRIPHMSSAIYVI